MRTFSCWIVRLLFVAWIVLQGGSDVFSQSTQGGVSPRESAQGALVVSLGKDSPNVGKDAFVTLSISTVEEVKVGRITSEISYPNNGEIVFDRAELTPDMKNSGAKLEVEKGPEGNDVKLKLTITGKEPILDGILCNVIFKVVNRPTGDKFAGEEQKVKLSNKSAAWTIDNKEIAFITSEPGEINFAYAPVVFACFFYMH
ncbi:MAG: hypothetical protein HY644_08455 [Acidobacteria bacterium]|nr:hypothetical protein [Acidobacteriota bacterium]